MNEFVNLSRTINAWDSQYYNLTVGGGGDEQVLYLNWTYTVSR